jgi:histidinol-phosphate aminotransferase
MNDDLHPRAAVLKMAPYSPPPSGRQDKLRLDFNENTTGCSPRVIAYLKSILSEEQLSIYPEYESARDKLSSFFNVSPDSLLLTNGTDEAIQVLLNTYVNDGEEVIILRPSFAGYRFFAEAAGACVSEVDYTSDTLGFPLARLIERITQATRAILLANPNNPTGTAVDIPGIELLLRRAQHSAVLIDEAYYEYYGYTALPLIATYPNLFVSRTFSKAYGLAALRIGCLFSKASNVASMRKAQAPYSVNIMAALAAAAAVQDQEFIAAHVAETLAARDLLVAGLRSFGVNCAPSSANFVLAFFGGRAAEVCATLRTNGILVRDRTFQLPGAVRITSGTREQVQAALKIIELLFVNSHKTTGAGDAR